MLSSMYKAKDKGIGTYITCPSNDAKRALNTAIFQMTETFNVIYNELSEVLNLRKADFFEHSKRDNNYYKQLIDEIKDENWTIPENDTEKPPDPQPEKDRQYVLTDLPHLIDYNHILGDLKSIASCQSADNAVNGIEASYCVDNFGNAAWSICFYMVGIVGVILLAVGFNKLILIIDRNAKKSLRGNKKYQGDDLDEDEEEEVEDGSRQIN
ncbi:MAG: hypothetical protein MJ252_22985 [archaeon]|nr:hypothetical protein [archaeon]